MTASFCRDDAKVPRESRRLSRPGLVGAQASVQQHQRLAVSLVGVPYADIANVDVLPHLRPPTTCGTTPLVSEPGHPKNRVVKCPTRDTGAYRPGRWHLFVR